MEFYYKEGLIILLKKIVLYSVTFPLVIFNKFNKHLFNNKFIRKRSLIGFNNIFVKDLDISDEQKLTSNRFELVDLRFVDLISKFLDFKDQSYFKFLDIGCGSGISTIYALEKLNFRDYRGIDLSKKLIEIANINKQKIPQPEKIEFNLSDAREVIMENKRNFIFMYNPFDEVILKQFIVNNFKSLSKNKSIIYFVNSGNLNIFDEFDVKVVHKIKFAFRISIIYF